MSQENVNTFGDDDWMKQAEINLHALANGAEGEMEKLDKEGNVHNLRYKLPPNLDANKFILKNRSKGKWADKTEITVTQTNINLTASFNEVNKLMEDQKRKIIEERKQIEANDAIDAEFTVVEGEAAE